MIEIKNISDKEELSSYYLFNRNGAGKLDLLEDISIVRLKVKEDGFNTIVNEEIEFEKLLEASLKLLFSSHDLYALYLERSPALKRKLRTYAGMFYRLRKQYGDEPFTEQEMDLPNNRSLFIGQIKVEPTFLSLFLDKLLINSRFVLGIFTEKETSNGTSAQQDTLSEFYQQAIYLEKEKHVEVNWIKAITLLSKGSNILFRITTDGQDNQYLEFYGLRPLMEARIIQELIPHLNEKFYLRQQQA